MESRRLLGTAILGVLSVMGRESRAEPEVRTASTHPMQYAVSLPSGWTEGKKWPVLVVVPDAGRDFLGNLDAFVKARGDRPYLLVAPFVVTSGGAGYRDAPSYRYTEAVWAEVRKAGDFRFDEEGIAAVMADVRKAYGGEDRYFLTGWEAGGHTVWAMLFRHPDSLRGVVPVSCNYRGRWVGANEYSTSPARADLPVRVIFCGKTPGLDAAAREAFLGQAREAMKVAADHGYRNVSLSVADTKPHGPLAEEVFATITALGGR